jgi:hypothetical protein
VGVAAVDRFGTLKTPDTAVNDLPVISYPDQLPLKSTDGPVEAGGADCGGDAPSVSVWLELALMPSLFIAVNTNFHCCAVELAGTDSVSAPRQPTTRWLLPLQNAGVELSLQDLAFVDAYVRTICPPADERLLVLIDKDVVGAGVRRNDGARDVTGRG